MVTFVYCILAHVTKSNHRRGKVNVHFRMMLNMNRYKSTSLTFTYVLLESRTFSKKSFPITAIPIWKLSSLSLIELVSFLNAVISRSKLTERSTQILLPSLMSGELMMTRLETSVENPGARQDWAMKPSLSSLRQTAWSSRRQSQPERSFNRF